VADRPQNSWPVGHGLNLGIIARFHDISPQDSAPGMSTSPLASRIPIPVLKSFVIGALASTGLSESHCQTTAEALVSTDALGVFTHGTKLLAGYLKKLQGGGYRIAGCPRIEREGLSWAVVDGDSALGQVGCGFALDLAIEKAEQCGTAFVSLRNTGHIGAAGHYAVKAARRGFIAIITGNDIPSVAAPGSTKAVLGSNPLAYAVPTSGDPILLDIATAAVAGGKIYAAHQRGEPIPSTWLIGLDGWPTTDGSLYPHAAALAPMAGHKGYGMGLLCEILSGVISGGHLTWNVGSWIFDPASRPSWHNASFQLIHLDAVVDRHDFNLRIDSLIDEIHSSPTAEGVDRVLLPGEREWSNRLSAQQLGIPLPQDVRIKLREAAEMMAIPVPAELQPEKDH
jgi:ureidoglycolate dehydrogenase (NAD+)